jgi:hypothetical protein
MTKCDLDTATPQLSDEIVGMHIHDAPRDVQPSLSVSAIWPMGDVVSGPGLPAGPSGPSDRTAAAIGDLDGCTVGAVPLVIRIKRFRLPSEIPNTTFSPLDSRVGATLRIWELRAFGFFGQPARCSSVSELQSEAMVSSSSAELPSHSFCPAINSITALPSLLKSKAASAAPV